MLQDTVPQAQLSSDLGISSKEVVRVFALLSIGLVLSSLCTTSHQRSTLQGLFPSESSQGAKLLLRH